ncbi:MAG: efflux RND transporter periplasmic adaptor subunit [Deltaproteobacteria bacterium]|jgi:RND family efflux transporter MFP subunit|nr:efflux RND transporter periplasmic adaptor subunit [Deltaproteobacteria bacterium]MBW2535977.1 efflux RND transporter periplasmic adaptor subunit [Deltaproteobacteria bacterium]
MRHSNKTLTTTIAAMLALLVSASCNKDDGGKLKLPSKPPKAAKAMPSGEATSSGDTKHAKAAPSASATVDADGTIRLTGTTAARQQSAVAAEGMGKLLKMHVREGDMIKKGQLIANLDASGAALRLKQAKAALAMAKVQLAATERERKRLEKLAAEGAVAGQKLDEVTSANEGAQAGVAQAEAAVAMASKAVGDSVVRAPFAGMVVRRLKAEGEWVSTMPPSPLILLAQIEPLDLTIQAPEHLLKTIQVGDRAKARFDATGQEIEGKVTRVVPVIMPPARSFTVIIEIPNEDLSLEPGVFAEVEITPQGAAEKPPEKKSAQPVAANEEKK